ncbi:MAG: DNA polymerase III subunit delta, partial [Bacteroidales bacterium]
MLFKDVLVDQALKQQLINLIKEKRISHAQLFLGQAGSHTFALAVAYAQYLCCENRGENDSCGVCPSCIKFEKLSHPDFHLIFPNCITKSVKKDPDSKQFSQEFKDFVLEHQYHLDIHDWLDHLGGENKQASINIRDCANIINQNSIRSYEGGYKIYILWMVERLYHAAAPKLLKTLEEPENKTLFILIAESSDKILSTILSRTQLIKLPRLSVETIQKQLVSDFNISSDTAHDIAEISEGNYHKAITLYQNNSDMKE